MKITAEWGEGSKTQWLRKAEIKRVDKGYQAKAKKGKAEAAY